MLRSCFSAQLHGLQGNVRAFADVVVIKQTAALSYLPITGRLLCRSRSAASRVQTNMACGLLRLFN